MTYIITITLLVNVMYCNDGDMMFTADLLKGNTLLPKIH